MKVAGHVVLFVCLTLPTLKVTAQGVTLEELFDHVAKTSPRYQSIELSPQYTELQYRSANEADWFLFAETAFNRDHTRGEIYRSDSLNSNGSVSVNKRSLTTSIQGSVSYNYSRYGSAYSSSYLNGPSMQYNDGSSKHYSSGVSTNLSAPLWKDGFGYSSRRHLEQSELELSRRKLEYQSSGRSFFVEVNHQFISLCGAALSASILESAHKQALELTSMSQRSSSAIGRARNSQHSSRYEAETAAALARAQSLLESEQVALSTYYDLPRLRSELPVCDLLQKQLYVSSNTEIDQLINATISMQVLALDERSLQLTKEIVYNEANPNLNLGLSYQVSGNDEEKSQRSLDRDNTGYRVSLNLSYPIGNTQALLAIDRVDLDRVNFSNNQRNSILQLQKNIRVLISNLVGGEKTISTLKQQVQIAHTTREQDMRAFEEGHIDIAFVEDSLRNELNAELRLANSAENYQRTFLIYQNETDQFPVRPKK